MIPTPAARPEGPIRRYAADPEPTVRATGVGMTGFILAGGQSHRMGREKASLQVGDHTLLELVAQSLRPLVSRLVVITQYGIKWPVCPVGVDELLSDVKPDCGPLMGLYTGLLHTNTSLNLFVPCDMPFIDSRLITHLAGACQDEVQVVASRHPTEGVQPFPLLCRVTACRTIGALLDQQWLALHALLEQPGSCTVRIEDPALWRSFTNINTAAEYETLLSFAKSW